MPYATPIPLRVYRLHAITSRNKGFTLIELLIALFVFAILAVTAYRGLNAITETRSHLDRETRQWQALERFFTRLDGEIAQALPRPVRLASGAEQPAWFGNPSSSANAEEALFSFTRNGGFDTEGTPLPPQRIGYRLRNGKVQLLRWTALDSAPYQVPMVDDVLEGIRELNVRYQSARLNWENQWPPAYVDAPLPRGVELTLVLQDGNKIVRVFAQK